MYTGQKQSHPATLLCVRFFSPGLAVFIIIWDLGPFLQIFCWGTFNLYIRQNWDWITKHILGLSCLCLSCCLQCLLQNWGLSASPASQTPSLLCSMFSVGNTKAAVCAFVPVSCVAYYTHTFLLLFLKKEGNSCLFKGIRKLKVISLSRWLTVEETHSVRCFHGTWTILSEGKTKAICIN